MTTRRGPEPRGIKTQTSGNVNGEKNGSIIRHARKKGETSRSAKKEKKGKKGTARGTENGQTQKTSEKE